MESPATAATTTSREVSAAKAEGKQKSQINTSELFNFPSLSPCLSPSPIELCILAQCENTLSRLFYVFILFFIFVFISFWERVICKRSTGLSQSSPNVVPSSSSSSSAFTSLCCKKCVVYITKVFYNLFSLRSHFFLVFFSMFFRLFIHLKFDFYLTC